MHLKDLIGYRVSGIGYRVSGKLLYDARGSLSPLLLDMFNKAFCHVFHPSLWSENFLKSIFKKDDAADPNN